MQSLVSVLSISVKEMLVRWYKFLPCFSFKLTFLNWKGIIFTIEDGGMGPNPIFLYLMFPMLLKLGSIDWFIRIQWISSLRFEASSCPHSSSSLHYLIQQNLSQIWHALQEKLSVYLAFYNNQSPNLQFPHKHNYNTFI